MRTKSLVVMMVLAVMISGVWIVFAQEPGDDDVRGAFLSSRPKTTNNSAPSRRHRTHNTNTNASSGTSKNANANTTAANTNTSSNKNSSKKPSQAIGIGYTLFMRDSSGRGVRVESSREFHNGDSVRLSLEPNLDGYIYIFDVDGDAPPQMIYPDPRLDAGDNSVEAHVPLEIPSSEENDERLRWFTFYGNSGTDHIYVVVTREPLKSVPTNDELVSFCALNKDKCPWHPSTDVWSDIARDTVRSNIRVVTSKEFGTPQSEKEKTATTRGLGLDQSAPLPSVIRINASTSDPVLVTVLDLIHE